MTVVTAPPSLGTARLVSLELLKIQRFYPQGPPERFESRARGLGWTLSGGWPTRSEYKHPLAHLFDIPHWVYRDGVEMLTLEAVAGQVKCSRFTAQRRHRKLLRARKGRTGVSLAMALFVPPARELNEWQHALLDMHTTVPVAPHSSFYTMAWPAATEACKTGLSVEEFIRYVAVTHGRIPSGAITAGVPAEYAAVL